MKKVTSVIKTAFKSALAVVACVALMVGVSACGNSQSNNSAEKGTAQNPVRIGVVGASESHWAKFKFAAEANGITVDITDFTEYSQPNPALSEKQLDMNQFQHILFLAKYNADSNKNLVPIGATAVFPISLYGDVNAGVKSLEDLKQGDTVAVPSDGTNQSRALLLLEAAKLIVLKDGHASVVTPADIIKEQSKVQVSPLQADMVAKAITDPKIAAAVVNNDFVKNLDDATQNNVLYKESAESESAKPYINVWAARSEDKDSEVFKKLINIFNSDRDTQEALAKDNGGEDKLSVVGNEYSTSDLLAILDEQMKIYRESKK